MLGYTVVVVRVQRLTQFQHDIVRDINDIVDRTHAGSQQTLPHPAGGGANLDTAHNASREARTEVRSLNGHLHELCSRRSLLVQHRLRQAQGTPGQRRHLARDTHNGREVTTVGFDREIQDHIAQQIDQFLPQRGGRIEDIDPRMIVAQTQFARRAEHALRDITHLARLADRHIAHTRTRQGQRDFVPQLNIGGATDDVQALRTRVHLRIVEMIGSLHLLQVHDLGADKLITPILADILDRLDLQPCHRQDVRELFRRVCNLDIILEPTQRYFHVYFLLLSPYLELAQEAQIIAGEETNLVDVVLQYGDALHTHAEGEASIAFGIIANLAQQFGMDH